MRIPRIYTPQPLTCGETAILEPQASKHISRVLRLKENHPIKIFNGLGGEYQATIDSIDNKSVALAVNTHTTENTESPINTHIAVAVSKGDKMDFIVQKCTELGASSITPIITERSDVKLNQERWQKKHQHWISVSISACEQSGRNLLPTINEVQAFSHWVNNAYGECCIFHPVANHSISALSDNSDYSLCFGSEGGFTDYEIETATTAGFKVIGLGPRILRAETAPLSALAIVQARWGDFTTEN